MSYGNDYSNKPFERASKTSHTNIINDAAVQSFLSKCKIPPYYEEIEDKYIGKIGTPERDQYEQELQEELRACHIGEAIKEARKAKNLTQEQLGALVGVQKAQISRLEKGKSITLSTLTRVFKAMGIPLKLDMGEIGEIVLC